MDNKVNPYSVEDIYDLLSGTTIDVPNVVVHVDALHESGYNLDALFKGNFSIILYLPGDGEVGHFTLLTDLGDNMLEYFDSLAGSIPEQVAELARRNGKRILTNKVRLQELNSNTCAKWCVARLFALPNSLKRFVTLYTGHTLSPDTLVNNIFVLKVPK